jgi:hypothetical protein
MTCRSVHTIGYFGQLTELELIQFVEIVSEFQQTDDNFILRFLNARKNNVPESFLLMANYYSYRQKNRQLFENFVPQDIGIQQALRDGFPGVLPERDR